MSYLNQILGTIISSALDYDNLCKIAGDSTVINNSRSSYIPCDGRSISGSELAKKTNMQIAPDLRGRFMRGLNTIYSTGQPSLDLNTADPEGDNRVVGSYQADDIKPHVHGAQSTGGFAHAQSGMGIQSNAGQEVQFGAPSITVNSAGGVESRPRNVGVYFYLKIN